MRSSSRRRFLMGMGGLTAAAGGGVTGWLLKPDAHGRDPAAGPSPRRVRLTAQALGTQVTITALHESRSAAAAAIGDAFAEIDLIERVMSLYRPHSQLCTLNRDGAIDRPHPHLLTVLREAQAVSRATGGAFDVTVQPLWRVYAAAHERGGLPAPADVEAARRTVDWRAIEVTDAAVRLRVPGMAVTLNGIAQGFAADRAMAVLRQRGVRHALIDAGEFAALGGAAGGRPWRVGVRHPRRADALASLAALRDHCLATSGDDATAFSDDRRHNHLFDPRTGMSPTDFASVSVVADSAMRADALSTAVYVLGARRGLALIESTDGTEALFVLKDGSVSSTAGFPVADDPA